MSPANNRFRVSVGIAAYNAEANIGNLLLAVTSQRGTICEITGITVHSDASSDRTVTIARENPDPRITVIDNAPRRGFAAAVQFMLADFSGDAIVLLNDDVKITDPTFIEKCVLPILYGNADLAGANVQPLPPRTFVEKASVSVFRVYERIRERMPDPHNMFTCDGAALALSRGFAHAVDFPPDPAQMGNVDAFLFLTCAAAGRNYAHARDAIVWTRSPATLSDYVRRNVRNDSQEGMLAKRFGPAVHTRFRAPAKLYWQSVAAEALRHPLATVFVFITGFVIRFRKRHAARNLSATWELLASSKKLD